MADRRPRTEFPSTPGGGSIAYNDEEEKEEEEEDEDGSEDDEDDEEEEEDDEEEEEDDEEEEEEDEEEEEEDEEEEEEEEEKQKPVKKSNRKKRKVQRPKRSLAFRSPALGTEDGEEGELNFSGRPSRRRRLQPPSRGVLSRRKSGGSGSGEISAASNALLEKQRRDEEYLAVYRGKLNSTQHAALNEECTLQRLVISSAVYDSLARKGGFGANMRPPTEGAVDKISLKFTLTQEVYLAMFQVSRWCGCGSPIVAGFFFLLLWWSKDINVCGGLVQG
jgi:hypothetical protein